VSPVLGLERQRRDFLQLVAAQCLPRLSDDIGVAVSPEGGDARGYRDRGMAAYSELQEAEFGAESLGYTAIKHQHEVGTGYFDDVAQVISGGQSSTTALGGSTEHEQF
jgi:hypothetical protein